MDTLHRHEIMARYQARAAQLSELAAARRRWMSTAYDEEHAAEAASPPLSPRQLQVLQFVADGLTNGEISRRLRVSEETVKTHIRTILIKLAAGTRAHAVAVGFRQGLLS